MKEQLPASFVDGSDVKLKVLLEEKDVILTAYDEKTGKKYRLIFSDCGHIEFTYGDDSDIDLYNLTDGIAEEESLQDGTRCFTVGFADESKLKIQCQNLTVEAL